MERSLNNILFIVEGSVREPQLLNNFAKSILHSYGDMISKESDFEALNIVSYSTDIYNLYRKMESYGFDNTTTLDVLKEIIKTNHPDLDISIFDRGITDIYLIFDLDYHIPTKFDKKNALIKMLDVFNNETENGLLLINYPMVESFRDCSRPLPDVNYFERKIKVCESINYKRICDSRGLPERISKLSKVDFDKLTLQNITKANFIVNGLRCKPSYSEFMDFIYDKKIFDSCFKDIENAGEINIICTCLYVFVIYYGEKYFITL